MIKDLTTPQMRHYSWNQSSKIDQICKCSDKKLIFFYMEKFHTAHSYKLSAEFPGITGQQEQVAAQKQTRAKGSRWEGWGDCYALNNQTQQSALEPY